MRPRPPCWPASLPVAGDPGRADALQPARGRASSSRATSTSSPTPPAPPAARPTCCASTRAASPRRWPGHPSVAFAYAVGDQPVATGYFPVRGADGRGRGRCWRWRRARRFASRRRDLRRALWVGVRPLRAGGPGAGRRRPAVGAQRGPRGGRPPSGRLRGEALARDGRHGGARDPQPDRRHPGRRRAGPGARRGRASAPATARRCADVLGEVERLRRLTEDFLDLAREPALLGGPGRPGRSWRTRRRAAWRSSHPGRGAPRLDVPALRVSADPGRHPPGARQPAGQRRPGRRAGCRAARAGRAAPGPARVLDDGAGRGGRRCADRLFEPFATGRAEGTGLGLAISRRIVERHGGTLALLPRGRPGAAFELRCRSRGARIGAMARVLVVDDEPKLGKLVGRDAGARRPRGGRAGSGREALRRSPAAPSTWSSPTCACPRSTGWRCWRRPARSPSPPEVILMTAHGTAESAVEAMKAGAADYVTKPFSMDELRLRVRRLAVPARRRGEERAAPRAAHAGPGGRERGHEGRPGRRPGRWRPTDATVLLLGESGTGKSQLARFIHYQREARRRRRSSRSTAPRSRRPCSRGSCSATRRAPSRAPPQRKAGHLAAADGGTLFLDEIGEITPATQVKLLRFLQERTFVPLGATGARTVDVRVISATNRDLEEAVQAGTFREDFFYRLNVFAIRVPPLRERRDDVLPLAERFLAARGPARRTSSAPARAPAAAGPPLARQRARAGERARAGPHPRRRGRDPGAEHLVAGASPRPAWSASAAELVGEGFSLDGFERELIQAALERAGGNKTHAATAPRGDPAPALLPAGEPGLGGEGRRRAGVGRWPRTAAAPAARRWWCSRRPSP